MKTTTPWATAEKEAWLKEQTIKRSYSDEVVSLVESLKGSFDVIKYGSLTLNPERYPVFLLKTKNFDKKKKTVLITGGVHGYETSGVHGALAFLKSEAAKFENSFNFLCAPCISPWAYETINRWNNLAVDPNRSFREESPAEESRFLVEAISELELDVLAHFDLHETTDTDNTVFRPALEKRDGVPQELTEIPDGFYVVGDSENPQAEFQNAVIDCVRKVTHIALPDENGKLIGVPLEQEGVVNYPVKKLFLCAGLTNAKYTTTTEVYPDSPKVTNEDCVAAQVAAITGGLEWLCRTAIKS